MILSSMMFQKTSTRDAITLTTHILGTLGTDISNLSMARIRSKWIKNGLNNSPMRLVMNYPLASLKHLAEININGAGRGQSLTAPLETSKRQKGSKTTKSRGKVTDFGALVNEIITYAKMNGEYSTCDEVICGA